MIRRHSFIALLGMLFVVAGLVLVAGLPVTAQDDDMEPQPEFLQSFYEAWESSGHADAESGSFTHWDEDGEISERCAQCHSTTGYLDFLGEDGSASGSVDAPAALGTTVNCDACHNETASNLHDVEFPSGAVVTSEDNAVRCMVCHQGRASGLTVENQFAEAGIEDMDAINEELGFINIHYYAAASTLYGAEVNGGYHYDDNIYQLQNVHVPGFDTCTSCHNPHTLEIQIDTCSECHDVEEVEDLRDIRMPGSAVDFDGDGDTREGLADEIDTMRDMLYTAIQAYSAEVAGTPLVYNAESYPYFFIDTDGDGDPSEEESAFGNSYNAWTGNLAAAAYNYQVSLKDTGSYAHNAVYHIQLLYDSIESLNGSLSEPIDMENMRRQEAGHFDVTAEAFRHWDEDGEVSARCSRCHTDAGLPFLLENGNTIDMPIANSLSCQTCHDSLSEFTMIVVNEVEVPSGAVISFGEEEVSNVCLACHQGRESGVSIANSIASADVGDNEVSEALRFQNPHYFAAGATLFGADANGGYQYPDMEYSGRYEHDGRRLNTCEGCHNVHTLENRLTRCVDCHEEVETLEDLDQIRAHPDDAPRIDYDGDGDADEPIAAEIQTFQDALLAGIQDYSTEVIGTPIGYAPNNYPYWYIDANEDGEITEEELVREGRYPSWTPTLLRATYNFKYVSADPGAYAHNPDYVLQILYDTVAEISGEDTVADWIRPDAVPTAMEETEEDSDD